MRVKLKENRGYYQSLKSMPCNCQPCSEYCQKVHVRYPRLKSVLANWQIDCTKPFEIDWIEDEETGQIDYLLIQYLCFGECEDTYSDSIDGLMLAKASSYPTPNVEGDFFIINVIGVD